MTFIFTFTTRETYFAERAAWRLAYAELTTKSRADKLTLKKAQRGLAITGAFSYRQPLELRKISAAAQRLLDTAFEAVQKNKAEAVALLECRAASKVEAARQRRANLEKLSQKVFKNDTIAL